MGEKEQRNEQKEALEKVGLSKGALVLAVEKLLGTQKVRLDRQEVHLTLVELKNTMIDSVDAAIYSLYDNDMHDYNLFVHGLDTRALEEDN